ncbi:peptidylprolyl isomerase [Flavobacterium myungsuense]|uniref:peptidylprolyl isomerase n=1 Tax=Flavobacterium myungsuense TaxID=651823 RepID=A0ABW3IXZ2_9FLAO
MKFKVIVLLFLGMMSGFAQNTKKPTGPKKAITTASKKTVSKTPLKKITPTASNEGIFAEFETSKGKIVVQLEYKKTPITVANFITLAEGKNTFVTDEKLKGKPYYDGLKFHRVIKDFMIQGGDPAGNGSGGSGYSFKDEFVPDMNFDKAGILAMANSGPATNSSQFFITHKDTPWLNQKHTIFGYVTTGQNVVDAIEQNDEIKKLIIVRKGEEAKKFDAVKTFSDYFANKGEDDKKQAAIQAEARAKQIAIEAEAKKVYDEKYAPVKADKVKYLAGAKATASKSATGLETKILQTGSGKKPTDGSTIYIHYAGYLEDGSLFDSSYEEVNKVYGKFDANRASQNGYQPFPFEAGKKDGLIPGFLEGISNLSFGDKALLFIPSNLGYGERGAGNVIPPNSNIIFEVELFETIPTAEPKK